MDEVDLWWELIDGGTESASPFLLHPGGGDTADVFPRSFCEALAPAVRFDPRDTGRSERTPDSTTYDLTDLAADVWRVVDAADLRRTCLLGYSLGALVVQRAAIQQPDRVAGLVLISTFARPPAMRLGDEAMARMFSSSPPENVDEALDFFTEPNLYFASATDDEIDEVRSRSGGDRAPSHRSSSRHQSAALGGPVPTDEELGSVEAPVLVIASTSDRVAPHEQADAVAQCFRNATVRRLDGVGHIPVERQWLAFADVIRHWETTSC